MLSEKLSGLKHGLNDAFPMIQRLSVATYRPEQDILQTFWWEEDLPSNIHNYEAKLSDCRSLKLLADTAQDRVINDLSVFDNVNHIHTALIRKAGFRSSFSVPLLVDGELLGFMFANSRELNVMKGEVVDRLRLIAMVMALLLHQDNFRLDILKSTVETMKVISELRNPETGEHLQRMASYSLMIARTLADQYQFTDIFIDYIYLYAPLHDIGKISTPDSILLKEGPLTDDEFTIMKEHSAAGNELAKKLIKVYRLDGIPYVSAITSIIRSHHEKMDGSGYPDRLVGDEITIEARIVAVADIFDALTSHRPYKKAWTNDESFTELKRLSGTILDKDCVDALVNNLEQIECIQRSFEDHTYWAETA